MTFSEIAAALGRIPSGIFILTARDGSGGTICETGMLSSWVMQAGFDPPMLTAAVRRDRYLAEWLTAGSPFVLNLVGSDHKDLLKHFSKGFEPAEPAFTGLEIGRSPLGLPILSAALGHLECVTQSHIDSGDHRIFLAEILSASLVDSESRPMVHIRKSGMHY